MSPKTKAEVEQPEPAEPTASIPRNSRLRPFADVRYTEEEYEVVGELAEMFGQPIGVYLGESSLEALVKAKPFLAKNAANAELMRELRECGEGLTRLAATARETATLPAAGELETALQEPRALIRQIASAGHARAKTSIRRRPYGVRP